MGDENGRIGEWSFYDTENQLLLHLAGGIEDALRQAEQEKDAILRDGKLHALEAYKQKVRETFLRAAGNPQPGQVKHIRQCGVAETAVLEITRILYTTEEDAVIPALVYQQKGRNERRPGILFLCGHEPDGKQSARYQEVCQLLAMHGFVVLCPEVAGQGERQEGGAGKRLSPTAAHSAAGLAALATGGNPARYMLQDAMAAVSVLSALPHVDAQRIGVTGNSGGGTQSMMLALADARIAAAAVGTFLSSQRAIFRSGKPQDAEQVWRDSLLTGTAIDHDDLLWAFSPRPLLVLAAEDDFFPFEGTIATVESAKRAYAMQGAGDRLTLYHEPVSHQYTHGMAREAALFFAKHFQVEACTPEEKPAALPPEQLWCMPEGDVMSAYLDSNTLKSRCTPAAYALAADIPPIMPDSMLAVKPVDSFSWHGLCCRRLMYAAAPGLYGVMCLFEGTDARHETQCDAYLWEGGTKACEEHKEQIFQSCSAGRTAAVIDLIGMGVAAPQLVNRMPLEAPFGTLYHLNAWLLRMGGSLAALRTKCLVRAMEYLTMETGLRVKLHAEGPYQLYVDYAELSGHTMDTEGVNAYGTDWLFTTLAEPVLDERLWPFVLPGIFGHNCDL